MEKINTREQLVAKTEQHEYVFVKFSAPWCGPCKQINPLLEKLQDQYENIDFVEVDIDDENTSELVKLFEVRSIPTMFVLKNDSDGFVSVVVSVGKKIGAVSGSQLEAFIESATV